MEISTQVIISRLQIVDATILSQLIDGFYLEIKTRLFRPYFTADFDRDDKSDKEQSSTDEGTAAKKTDPVIDPPITARKISEENRRGYEQLIDYR